MDKEFKIICPFCNKEYTADMKTDLESSIEGCETCGQWSEINGCIEIKCSNCKKVVYKKEGRFN